MTKRLDPATLGEWSDNADRLVPRGDVIWTDGPLGCAGAVNGKPVASARKAGRSWMLRIAGWQWHVNPDMGVARMNQLPGDKIKLTPVKAFGTAAAAKKEAGAILQAPSK